ncbi:MAG TPA: glycosyltransferase family 39 protein, partial [Gemmataceae bacterium]|nr:glycosyltransferase family 39 protein [Gemmataceae bacterium]
LPSALAATVTVLLMFWYFRRQLGPTAGLLAAAMTPLSFMWLDKATAAEIDMLQVAWVTAAIVCFLRALETDEETRRQGDKETRREEALLQSPRPWLWWLAALLCVAGGVLTKWTAPAFFYGTVVPLLWWRGRLRLLFRREHLVSAAVGAATCFAWAGLAVSLGGWDAFYDTVSREALMRLAPAQYSQAYPWRETLLHPLRLLAASLPCSAFALLTLRPGFARAFDDRGRRLLQALHCWTWPNIGFWSFVSQHSPRHSFPLFPGLAGLAALCWLAWLKGWQRWPLARVAPGRVLVGLLVLWLAVKLVFVHVSIPRRMHGREPRAKGEQLAALVPAGQTLYLFRVKDEGIMFYYRRPVRRLTEPAQLPSPSTPVYCILDAVEWQAWPRKASSEVLLKSRDEQGDPLVLVRLWSQSGSSR